MKNPFISEWTDAQPVDPAVEERAWVDRKSTARAADRLGILPHCDERVLHEPGVCVYCDKHPKWQALRIVWGIAFSGIEPVGDEIPCPSTARRPAETIQKWGGNRPSLPPIVDRPFPPNGGFVAGHGPIFDDRA